ncbi:MAG: DNA-binding transcriptional LysR family regulator [Limisphaerales bacterium]|jgi:DNA-binding transcriptional LysR family regulator
MELYQLSYFIALAEQRNFTRAAEKLNLAQPALSQQIRNLETELGASLFVRGRRETVLTRAGETLLPRARALLTDADSARRAVAQIADLKGGRLTVAAIPSMSGQWLPSLIQSFRRSFPAVELVLMEGRSDEVCELVFSAAAEVGFVQLPVAPARFDATRLFHEPFMLLLPSKHQLVGAKSISLKQLSDEPFVLYKGKARETVVSACRTAGFTPRISCETGEIETVRALVAAELGIAVLPQLAVQEPLKHIVVKKLSRPSLRRDLGVITKRGHEPSPATRAFLKNLPPAGKK